MYFKTGIRYPVMRKEDMMETNKDTQLSSYNELLEQRADMYAWDKYVEYLEDLYDIYEGINYGNDPGEREAAEEVYKEAYKEYLDKHSSEY